MDHFGPRGTEMDRFWQRFGNADTAQRVVGRGVRVLIGDPASARAVLVIEVQTLIDADKRRSWPLYLAGAFARHGCEVDLVVVSLDRDVVAWASRPIVTGGLGGGLTLAPIVIGLLAGPLTSSPATIEDPPSPRLRRDEVAMRRSGEDRHRLGCPGTTRWGGGRYTAGMATVRSPKDESAWQAAIAFGIDVTLLEANLERTPAERLRELVAMNQFQA